MPAEPLILSTDRGLYCPAGDFHIDAWEPVPRTILTHAHGDHARPGCERYLATAESLPVLRERLGETANIDTLEYGESRDLNGVKISLHPAGHLLGSAQVRVERDGEVWLITGDYKRQPDPTCRPFELVRCHTLITECTFGLPIFRWKNPAEVIADINAWWRHNVSEGRNSILVAYALGKAQRLLASVDASIGPILLHGAVMRLTDAYRRAGVALPPAEHASPETAKRYRGTALILCPPLAIGGTWIRKFNPWSIGVASGWMQIRGFRRRGGIDRGFVLSDHADWPSLLETIRETAAEKVIATHGYTRPFARYLAEQGMTTDVFETRFANAGEEELEPQKDEEIF